MAKGKGGISRKAEGGALATPKLQELTGSEKQVTWAEDIRGNAFATLRNLEPEAGKIPGGFDRVRYDRRDLLEVKKSLVSVFSDEKAKKASAIIDLRGRLSAQRLTALAIDVHRGNMRWDERKKQFVKRK